MKWQKVTIHTTVEAEDLISLMLSELGIDGVEIENNVPLSEEDVQTMFIDILPEEMENDGTSRVSFYLHEEDEENGEHGEHAENTENTEETENVRAAGKDCSSEALQKITACTEPGMSADGTADNSYAIQDRIWSRKERKELLGTIREKLKELSAYCDIGEGRLELSESLEEDWRDQWKAFFQPILVDRILILPSWLEVPEENEKQVESGSIHVVRIDPGVAFGTGNHETTRLCIPELVRAVKPGSRVLDLGSGSGILGMAAARLGAGLVTAVDIDPACRKVLEENIAKNDIAPERFPIIIGNVLSDSRTADAIMGASGGVQYDVAVANILAPVIVNLAAPGAADRFLKPGGTFITSGILDSKEDEVLEAFRKNPVWEDVTVSREGEWVEITARRRI